jgi:hypothetical protein
MNQNVTPIIVGVGKYVSRETPTPEKFLSALDIADEAGQRTIDHVHDRADLGTAIEVMVVSRSFEDSVRKVAIVCNPYGRSNNVPGQTAQRRRRCQACVNDEAATSQRRHARSER